MRRFFLLFLFVLMPGLAFGGGREVVASNGVSVHVTGDEFDGEMQYTSPMSKIDEFSFFLVASIKPNGNKAGPILVAGNVYYEGEWRNYSAAKFRGGETANAVFNDRKVVTCRGGGRCTLSERFQITLTQSQISKYSSDGFVALKLKANDSIEEPIVRVPASYISAVREVSDR